MSEITKLIEIAKAEEGYLEKKSNKDLDSKTANAGSNNYTKYARDLDNLGDFYNGKKNGYAWCDVFVDWCFVKAFGRARAQELLCQPNKSTGAGVGYSRNYYKNKGQYYTSEPKVGDQIFFKNASGGIQHTGLVIGVTDSVVYTIEGNTSSASGVVANGGCVRCKSYGKLYKYIDGYGRPKYKEEPQPVVSNIKYVFNCESLNIRKSPNGILVNELVAGTKVTVYEEKNGWSRIGTNQWVYSNNLTVNKPSKVYSTKVISGATGGLNVRTSNNFTIKANICKEKSPLPNGTIVSLVETSGNGIRIGKNRWVHKNYVK